MTPDTTALRALADRAEAAYNPARLDPATVRALCDGYDEAQRLRDESLRHAVCCRTAERHAALVADLRALAGAMPDTVDDYTQGLADYAMAVRAVIDRHAPDTTGGAG